MTCFTFKLVLSLKEVSGIKSGINLRVYDMCLLTRVSESRLALTYKYM